MNLAKIHVATGTSESSSLKRLNSEPYSDAEAAKRGDQYNVKREPMDKDENRGALEREQAQLSEILEEDREAEIDNIHSKVTGNFGNSYGNFANSYTHTMDSGFNVIPVSSLSSSTHPKSSLKGIGTGLVMNDNDTFTKAMRQDRTVDERTNQQSQNTSHEISVTQIKDT